MQQLWCSSPLRPSSRRSAQERRSLAGVLGAMVVTSTVHRSDTSYGMEQVQLDYSPISQPLVRNRYFSAFPRTLLNLTSASNSGVVHK